MLLTDGSPNTTEDLRIYESSVLDVANTESIDLKVKLKLALEEVSEDVLDILLENTSMVGLNMRRMMGVTDVVVTPQLKRWHAVHTLEVFYRDTFNNQLNDRYQAKVQEYHELSRSARLHAMRFGIGLVGYPIPQACLPAITYVAAPLVSTIYYVQVAWVSSSGQVGQPSVMTTAESVAGSAPVIGAIQPPPNAVGFNVYMGTSDANMALQNATAVPVGGSYKIPNSGLVTGPPPGNGQAPDTYITAGAGFLRG
jgi:hypothetical protein